MSKVKPSKFPLPLPLPNQLPLITSYWGTIILGLRSVLLGGISLVITKTYWVFKFSSLLAAHCLQLSLIPWFPQQPLRLDPAPSSPSSYLIEQSCSTISSAHVSVQKPFKAPVILKITPNVLTWPWKSSTIRSFLTIFSSPKPFQIFNTNPPIQTGSCDIPANTSCTFSFFACS